MKHRTKKLAKATLAGLRPATTAALLAAVLAFLFPLLALTPEDAQGTFSPGEGYALTVETGADAQPSAQTEPPEAAPSGVTVTVLLNGKNQVMELSEYLWGVVAAEMPAAFQQEALNAQAIAARTYTLYRMNTRSEKHPNAQLCGDPGCCQAWISRQDRMANWDPDHAAEYTAKITQAVESTQGLYLSYEGQPILAAFHASSAGNTKSALSVWGEDFPYLQSVSSPEETDSIPNYYSTVEVKAEDALPILKTAAPKGNFESPNCADWLGELRYGEDGLPSALQVGGVWVDTGTLRTLFGLRSASFTVEAKENTITFYVTGYGHGVGMSQYGANALAKQGKTAAEILTWYYQGAELSKLEE